MKKVLTILIVLIFAYSALLASSTRIQSTDTLIIELGNNSKLIIYVDSQKDLKDKTKLNGHDILQKMVKGTHFYICE